MNGTTVTTYARDGQKSIRAALNGSTVTGSWRYRAYGEIAQSSGTATPSLLGYAGQLRDPSGLSYMRARWYDPTTARFLSRDLVPSATAGAFGYAGDNPLRFFDPAGMFPLDENDRPRVAQEVESEMSENGGAANLEGRRLRDWRTGEYVRDAGGRYRLPDNQIFTQQPVIGSGIAPSRIVEAATGGPQHLVRKVDETMNYVDMAGQAYPGAAPRVELRFQLRVRGAGPIGGFLMLVDTYNQWLDMIQQENSYVQWNS